MSITFEISKFAKPTKKELSVIDKFNAYDSFRIVDEDGDDNGWCIYLFRIDDKSVSNLVDSHFAVKMVLPELVTDYEKLYADLDFDNEAIKNNSVHVIRSNVRYMDISDGGNTKQINNSMLARAEIPFLIFEKNRGKCFIEMY